jgi:hypothetical protein
LSYLRRMACRQSHSKPPHVMSTRYSGWVRSPRRFITRKLLSIFAPVKFSYFLLAMMLPFKLYISLCATFLQATSVLAASSTSKSTITSSAAPSTSTTLNQATSTSSNTFIPLPTGDQPAVPSKYPSIQELADYFQISPGCAACMVPPLGPYAGGLEDSRCTGYAMKDLCTSSSTETPGVLACDPPYSSNEHCYIYNCSTPDIQRLFYPQTCQDNYDPAYNEIAHLAEYCLDLGVSYANVSGQLRLFR